MDTTLLLDEFIPEELRRYFCLESFEKKKEWALKMVEKEECVPKELNGKSVAQNGYMNPVEIIDFPFQGRLVYLKFYRRRWKEKGEKKSYWNEYRFHRKGMKTTDAFGDFLKGLTREEFDEFCTVWPRIRDFWKKDIRLVSKCLKWLHRCRGPKDSS